MKKLLFVPLVLLVLSGCTKKDEVKPVSEAQAAASSTSDIGIGPVKELKLEDIIDANVAKKGKEVFDAKCAACHKFGERYVGPDLKGVTVRRRPEWIMNMILNPVEMTQKDEKAKELLGEFLTQMTFQNVTQDEARTILEYMRDTDKK